MANHPYTACKKHHCAKFAKVCPRSIRSFDNSFFGGLHHFEPLGEAAS